MTTEQILAEIERCNVVIDFGTSSFACLKCRTVYTYLSEVGTKVWSSTLALFEEDHGVCDGKPKAFDPMRDRLSGLWGP